MALVCLVGGAAHSLAASTRVGDYVHTVWTTAEGLPQNSVNDVVRTPDGYLWIATFGGLARFDGVRFTVFDVATAPGLSSNRLTALHVDADGVLWIGSEPGFLSRYENGRFTTLGPADGLPEGAVVWDIDDDGGGLWIGTSLGLVSLADGRATVYDTDDGLGNDSVTAIACGKTGEVWAGTGTGVTRWRGDGFDVYPLPEAARGGPVYALSEDRSGRLWVGLVDGLAELAGDEVRLRIEQRSSWSFLATILEDRRGSLWFGTRGLRRSRSGGESSAPELLLSDQTIRSLYEDHEGNIWIGTSTGGLHRLSDAAFWSVLDDDVTATTAIVEGRDGEMLIGRSCAGLVRLKDGIASPVALPSPGFICVSSLAVDRHGTLWVGARHLARGGAEVWTVYRSEDGVPNTVRALYEDRRGVIWAGTRSGLASLEGARPRRLYTVRDGLVSPDVRFITEGRDGDLWIGTPQGMARFAGGVVSPETATHYTTRNGLPHDFVRAIHADERGVLWIGTYGGGLVRLEGDALVALTTRHGLRENTVSRILDDGYGNLWMSGNRGITRLRRSEADAFAHGAADRVYAVLYDEDDGMSFSETNGGFQPAGTRSSDGRLWFPTLRGAAVVDPAGLRAASPPPVAIERVRVERKEMDLSGPIMVAPGDGDLEIEYTGLRLGRPEEVEFRYRLVGLNDAWIEVGHRRTAYFTHMPPGSYRFEVTAAAHAGGTWNDRAATVDLVFEPLLWQRRWFQVLAAVASAALVTSIVGWRLHRARRRAFELEAINVALGNTVRELEASNAEMERFTYTVSHDLKSPLVTILGFVGMARQDAAHGRSHELEHDLLRIDSAARTMGRQLAELLELSRIGRVLHTPSQVELTELAREAAELVAGELEARGVEVEIAENLPRVVGDRPRLLEVFQNLFDNAARFMGTEAHPHIEVGRRDRDGETVIYVRDNGVGIDPRYHEKVFGLFDRLDTTTEGTGIGLALVKRIVEFHGGRVWVESPGRGHGSTFCFTLGSRRCRAAFS